MTFSVLGAGAPFSFSSLTPTNILPFIPNANLNVAEIPENSAIAFVDPSLIEQPTIDALLLLLALLDNNDDESNRPSLLEAALAYQLTANILNQPFSGSLTVGSGFAVIPSGGIIV